MNGRLIIVPGWLQTSDQWARAQAELPGWDVHVIDLPGFGNEPLVSKDWGVAEYGDFVRERIQTMRSIMPKNRATDSEKLLSKKSSGRPSEVTRGRPQPDYFLENCSESATQNQRIVLLGHSFGGRVLSHLFGSASTDKGSGKLFSADVLILYAAPCLYRPALSVYLRNKLARMAKQSGLARVLPNRFKTGDLRQAEASGMAEIFKRSIPYSQETLLQHITVPTELVWGSADDHVPLPIAEEMQHLIPHAHLTVLPGEGHNIHLDNPTLFWGTLRKILTY